MSEGNVVSSEEGLDDVSDIPELLEYDSVNNVLVDVGSSKEDIINKEQVYDDIAEYASDKDVLADAPTDASDIEEAFSGSDLRMIVAVELESREGVRPMHQADLTGKGITISEDIEERGGKDYLLLVESPNIMRQFVDDDNLMKYLGTVADRVQAADATAVYVDSSGFWEENDYQKLKAIMDAEFSYQ